jgi:GT2 family glycosyltransferase
VSGEIIVVDNNSIDGSNKMVLEKFPSVALIENKKNVGFSMANNQGIEISKGKYVLLLNPDTVVEEDTFEKVTNFMDKNPDAGALGVRMLDGKGRFLPESKRGLPTPSVAFYKIFGFSSLFPKSKLFGKYHLGYLSEFEVNKVEVLSGAFMLLRKECLDKIGLLDETFFMYGEDIDLSYRVTLGGYNNYYFPETRIIHYKGESTKKSSVNYVFVFYRAMVIFAEKHFSSNNAQLFSFLINIAIYVRAGLAIFARFLKKAFLPIVDATFLFSGLYLMTHYWQQIGIEFPQRIFSISLPMYLAFWMLLNLYAGTYDLPFKIKKSILGTILGTISILVVYGLLPKDFQFSRLYILLGATWITAYFMLSRVWLHFVIGKKFRLNVQTNSKFIIIGSPEESERVASILKQINPKIDSLNFISANDEKSDFHQGIISQLDQFVAKMNPDELIFCAKDVSAQEIIKWMSNLENVDVDFKIAQPDSLFLIGSNSIHSAGDLYLVNVDEISKKSNKRLKRTFDILVSLFFLLFFPILIFNYKKKGNFIKNMFQCLVGIKTIVGYFSSDNPSGSNLPRIRNGVLSPFDTLKFVDENLLAKLNLIYARDYHVFKDFIILQKAWKKLDR